jgi:hypothetical protein
MARLKLPGSMGGQSTLDKIVQVHANFIMGLFEEKVSSRRRLGRNYTNLMCKKFYCSPIFCVIN